MTTHPTYDINRMQAYYYACGYNDHRQQETGRPQPYVDPSQFASYWCQLVERNSSRPSVQDAFKAFAAQVVAS